jgi:DNA-directed RNA polymerase specialized sigma subunit
MSNREEAKKRSEMLKRLRDEHSQSVARTQALLKEQKRIQTEVCQTIREKSKTVPEIAREINMPTDQTLWYLTAFKKYDLVVEDGMCEDYVLYKRAEEKK